MLQAGWLLGIVLVILGAIAGDLIGIGGSQFVAGIGMGAGVRYMQGRVAKQWFGRLGTGGGRVSSEWGCHSWCRISWPALRVSSPIGSHSLWPSAVSLSV